MAEQVVFSGGSYNRTWRKTDEGLVGSIVESVWENKPHYGEWGKIALVMSDSKIVWTEAWGGVRDSLAFGKISEIIADSKPSHTQETISMRFESGGVLLFCRFKLTVHYQSAWNLFVTKRGESVTVLPDDWNWSSVPV